MRGNRFAPWLAGCGVVAVVGINSRATQVGAPCERSVQEKAIRSDVQTGDTRLTVDLVARIRVEGPSGSARVVEWSERLGSDAVWQVLTNVTIGAEARVVVDLEVGPGTRYYRARETPAGFVWIWQGSFVMGSPASEPNRGSDEVQHTVALTQGFWFSDHETTQAEYEEVTGINPSYFRGAQLPVQLVDWYDAREYCSKLTEKEAASGRLSAGWEYRLPTEAEWEYAARAGTGGAFAGSLDAMGWYANTSGDTTHGVRTKQANGWGLYDMAGNVAEWCLDWHAVYPAGPITDPMGGSLGSFRIVRGGNWVSGTDGCRSASRGVSLPGNRSIGIGFRPVIGLVR